MLTSLLLSALAATSVCLASPRTTKWSQLAIQPHQRHLARTISGEPFLWQADTAWELAARLNASDVDAYLADRASKGFNVIQVVALPELNGTTHPNYYGDLPLVDQDPTQPVEEYFEYLDWVIDRAADYGGCDILLFLTLVVHTHPKASSQLSFRRGAGGSTAAGAASLSCSARRMRTHTDNT